MPNPQVEANKEKPVGLAMEFYHQAIFYYFGETYRERIRVANFAL